MATLDDAILIAVKAHRGQTDKAGHPYIFHPIRMMLRFRDRSRQMAAILHDVVEDSDWTLDGLLDAGIPQEVVNAVDHLTSRKDETYEEFIERASKNPIAAAVKLADLEDNMDLRRLTEVGEKDLIRLRKYREAWGKLTKQAES